MLALTKSLSDMNAHTSSVALSGLRVAELGLSASAHNVANLQTPGFRRQLLQQEEQAGGGVVAHVTRVPQEGANLAEDVVKQKVATYAFVASLRVIQTHDHMLGTLLDAAA